jgi:hypothetical protein
MNRSLVAVAVVLLTMLTPTNASAWIGWLDSLTGPGPFWGLLFDVRAICFGERVDGQLMVQARALDRLVDPKTRDNDNRVIDAWRTAAVAWAVAFRESPPQPDPNRGAAVDREYVARQEQRAALMAAAGVFFTVCPPEVVRRSSIDVAIELWWARRDENAADNERFADDESVRLTTAKVSYSFPLFRNREYDVLDVSIGAGFYWLSSRGFVAPITGTMLEPARIYLRAPTSWHTEDRGMLRKLLTYPVFSAAAVVFPKGFQDNVFLGPGQIARGITQRGHPAEIQPSFAVFVNIFPKPK